MADSPAPLPRLATGVPGLDELLGGGLLSGRSTLIKGPPGSGKTTLGLQMLVAGAANHGEPGILLTFELEPSQLVADGLAIGWDLNDLSVRKLLKVFFVNSREMLEKPGRQENRILMMIKDWVQETKARRILIDSLSHLPALYTGEEARASFMNFMLQLKELGLTPVMTAELLRGNGSTDVDAYLADNVILVDYHKGGLGKPDRRELEILKTRGHAHIPGAHPVEIGQGGLRVFPHGYPDEAADIADGTLSTGVQGMDDLLGGGYARGSSVLLAGLSGTFKTTLAGHIALAAAGAGEPVLWVSLQQNAADLEAALAGLGLDLAGARKKGSLRVLEFTPGRDPVEKVLHEVETALDSKTPGLVVIDSMTELTSGIEGEDERRESAQFALRRLRALGATVVYTEALARVTGRNPLSEISGADLADTLIYLGLVEIESRLEKVVSVLKHRGGAVTGDLRSITCGPEGLSVSDRFVGLSGVLGGSASGQRKAQIETIFQPLYFLRDFLVMAKDPGMAPEKREHLLNNLSSQTEKLIGVLGEYFDQPVSSAKPSDGKGGT